VAAQSLFNKEHPYSVVWQRLCLQRGAACQVSHTAGGDRVSQLDADDVMIMRLAPKVVGTQRTNEL